MDRLTLAVTVFAAIAATGAARAATIQIDFDAHVVSVSSGVAGDSLAVGDSVHGHVVIDRDGPIDLEPAPDFGFYSAPNYPVISFVLTIGGDYTVTTGPPNSDNQIIVYDNYSGTVPPIDLFSARSPVIGAPVNGFAPLDTQFALFGLPTLEPGGNHLVGDDIPTAAELASWQLDLGTTNGGGINFLVFQGPAGERVDWDLDGFSVVPEPAAGWLLAVALFSVRRRSARGAERNGLGIEKRRN